MKIYKNKYDFEKYFTIDYYLESTTTLAEAAWNLAIGQSVGNPNQRNLWETDELFEKHSCIIIGDEEELKNNKNGHIQIAFPIINTDWSEDGISHLLCQIMGGQLDIDIIKKCHVLKIRFPESVKLKFKKPKYGITGIREFTGVYDKPLFGGIVKPKTGVSSDVLLEMVKQMVDGGVNFIKEDEILSNPTFCRIEERVPKIMKYLDGKRVIYSVCINSDPAYSMRRAKMVYELGGNSIHINFWSGLGVYKSIRDLDLPLFIHFQKSGDKILTNKSHDFHIDWNVICYLAGLMGVDTIHAGMSGGYSNTSDDDLKITLNTLYKNNVMPALSCGMHPGLVQSINRKFGVDYMANVGGAIHGHPGGSIGGARAMRQAIDKIDEIEYKQAIAKWGFYV
jgi:ribulose-bisphosphate carboxylase large chain